MGVRTVDDKASDTLVVVSAEGFWTGSSTLPHLHQLDPQREAPVRGQFIVSRESPSGRSEGFSRFSGRGYLGEV